MGEIEENRYAIDGTDTVSVLTAMEGLTNILDKGLERILLIDDDVLYILTKIPWINLIQSKVKKQEHLLSSFKFIDSNNKDDPDGNNEDDD